MNETLPDPGAEATNLPTDRPLKVYAEYEYVQEYLTDKQFVLTNSEEEADILWFTGHYKDYRFVFFYLNIYTGHWKVVWKLKKLTGWQYLLHCFDNALD